MAEPNVEQTGVTGDQPGKVEVAPSPAASTTRQEAPGATIEPQVAPAHASPQPKRDRPGRPSKMNDEILGKLEQVFALDGTIEEACFYAEINPDTYYEWVKADPKLSERFKALREKPVLAARQRVVNLIKEDADGQTARWYLERKRKKEFGPKLDITSDDKALIPSEAASAAASAAIAAIKQNDVRPSPNNSEQGGQG